MDGHADCFSLCKECDRVFHKSAAKRGHIRIPLHPTSLDASALSSCLEIDQKQDLLQSHSKKSLCDQSVEDFLVRMICAHVPPIDRENVKGVQHQISVEIPFYATKLIGYMNDISRESYLTCCSLASNFTNNATQRTSPIDSKYSSTVFVMVATSLRGLLDDSRVS